MPDSYDASKIASTVRALRASDEGVSAPVPIEELLRQPGVEEVESEPDLSMQPSLEEAAALQRAAHAAGVSPGVSSESVDLRVPKPVFLGSK